MPELPEVETIKNGLLTKIKNKTILQVNIYNFNLRWPIATDLPNKIRQQNIIDIMRRGKYLIFKFISGQLIVHLGMSGVLTLAPTNTRIEKHDHVEIIFTDNIVLRYNDQRRFGCMFWSENYKQHDLIKNLGPEPFSCEFNADYFFQKAQKRKNSIKSLIMDSKFVVGVGNIYAAEALFLAKINPVVVANKLTCIDCARLVLAIKNVLATAIKFGGTSIKDYRATDGKEGYFQERLLVYGRNNKPCKICNTTISSLRLSGRNTFYCAKCQ